MALKGLEIILSITFSIETSKVKVLERLHDYIKNEELLHNRNEWIDLTIEDSHEVLDGKNDGDEAPEVRCQEISTDTAIVVELD